MSLRNPYLILGLPFGASREEVDRAFERRRGPLQASADEHRDELADLEWAVRRIKEGPDDPSLETLVYRLPSDADAMRADGGGVFAPPPETPPADWATTPTGVRVRAAAAYEYLRQVLTEQASRAEPPAP
jgi:hypothetical protein